MSRARQTLLWMAGLSLVTLCLGVLRELWIARELRASGEADLFFRGLVVVGAARAFGTALFRSRWIPVPATVPARRLLRAEAATCAAITGCGWVALVVIAGVAALRDPTLWVFAVAVALATVGSAVRALAERAGLERRGFVLEWALPIGAIAGALTFPKGALGPASGILLGLVVGLVALLPPVLSDRTRGTGREGQVGRDRARGTGSEGQVGEDRARGTGSEGQVPQDRAKGTGSEGQVPQDMLKRPGPDGQVGKDMSDGTGTGGQVVEAVDPRRTRVLLLDALVYANLGLLDAGLSQVFPVGGFALLNYAYLFVNAALVVPSAAATVVGLRASAGGDPAAHAVLRRWAVLGGVVCAGLVVAVGLLLGWGPIAARVDAAVGWSLAAGIGALVLWSAPFAGLRLANTIGRQFVIATEPRRVLVWDLVGFGGRALILGFGAQVIGLVASPLGLAFAEAVQVAAWWRAPRR